MNPASHMWITDLISTFHITVTIKISAWDVNFRPVHMLMFAKMKPLEQELTVRFSGLTRGTLPLISTLDVVHTCRAR